MNEPAKKDQEAFVTAFHELLRWLDEGTDSKGEKFLEMRGRLVAYFDRKNCSAPDELADETLNRVARRLDEVGTIESETPAKYCYTVARFVFLEYLRSSDREQTSHLEMQRETTIQRDDQDSQQTRELMLNCLDGCLGKLGPANRELILRYYIGQERGKIENRRALAAELNITMNALAIRACRIRNELEACVQECARSK